MSMSWRAGGGDAELWRRNCSIYDRSTGLLHTRSHTRSVREVDAPITIDPTASSSSELTDPGKAFVKSRADERWLMSFDKPGSKKVPSDWTYLDKQLQKIPAE